MAVSGSSFRLVSSKIANGFWHIFFTLEDTHTSSFQPTVQANLAWIRRFLHARLINGFSTVCRHECNHAELFTLAEIYQLVKTRPTYAHSLQRQRVKSRKFAIGDVYEWKKTWLVRKGDSIQIFPLHLCNIFLPRCMRPADRIMDWKYY